MLKLKHRQVTTKDLVAFLKSRDVYEEFMLQFKKRQPQFYKRMSLDEFMLTLYDADFISIVILIVFYQTTDLFWLNIQDLWAQWYGLITGNAVPLKINKEEMLTPLKETIY